MRLVLGPYDLVSPSAAAAVALMLGADDGGVVTLAPAPLEGESAEALRSAADRAPRFWQLLDSWRWTTPLWRAGLLVGDCDGDAPLEDIRAICARIGADPKAGPLRALGSADLFSNPQAYLETLSRDLLRGGGDPSVSIPLNAGLERFAARHGLPLVRLAGGSLSARLDKRSSIPIARFTVPMITGAAPVGYLEARKRLTRELAALRSTLQTIIALTPAEAGAHGPRLAECCREFAESFHESVREVLNASAHAGEPARLAEVAVTVSLAPVGATLDDVNRAAEALGPAPGASNRARATPGSEIREPEPRSELNLPRLAVLTAKPAPWDLSPPPKR